MFTPRKIRPIVSILILFGLFCSTSMFSPVQSPQGSHVLGPAVSAIGNYSCGKGSPCPMGISDYGKSSGKTYSYTTSKFVSWANFTTLNIPSGGISLQQNLVAYGVAVQHNIGEYWIQNVPTITKSGSTYSINFENNIWNFSKNFNNHWDGTLKSSDIQGNLVNQCLNWGVSSNEYYACESSETVTATGNFQIETLTAVFTIKAGAYAGDTSVNFSTFVYQGRNKIGGGQYDQVAFSSEVSSSPVFKVGGKDPGGFFNDAELIMGGPCCSESAAVSGISAHLSEFYLSKGKLVTIPHAWSAGADTAETVSGVKMTASSKTGVASHGTDNNVELW